MTKHVITVSSRRWFQWSDMGCCGGGRFDWVVEGCIWIEGCTQGAQWWTLPYVPPTYSYNRGQLLIDQIYIWDQLFTEKLTLQSTLGNYETIFLTDHHWPLFVEFLIWRNSWLRSHHPYPPPLIVQLLRSTDTNPQLLREYMKAAILSVESQGLDNNLCDLVGRMRQRGESTRRDDT